MALPSSGQLSIGDIRDVVDPAATSNVSLRALSNTAGFSIPDSISEFYGYSSTLIQGTSTLNGYGEYYSVIASTSVTISPTVTYVSGSGEEGDPAIYDVNNGRFANGREFWNITLDLSKTISELSASGAEMRYTLIARGSSFSDVRAGSLVQLDDNSFAATTSADRVRASSSLPYSSTFATVFAGQTSSKKVYALGGLTDDFSTTSTWRWGIEFRNY